MNKKMVPLFLSTDGMRVMVFGGGNIALRKCNYFKGAKITVIAKKILPEVKELAEHTIEEEIPSDLKSFIDDAEIVIAATDNKELNNHIRDVALYQGIYVNSAHGGGNILIPSVLRRDKYTVAISTEGRVPAFPPYLVSQLDGFLDERYDITMDLLMDLRKIIRTRIDTPEKRREYLQSVLSDDEVDHHLKSKDLNGAKHRALILGGLE